MCAGDAVDSLNLGLKKKKKKKPLADAVGSALERLAGAGSGSLCSLLSWWIPLAQDAGGGEGAADEDVAASLADLSLTKKKKKKKPKDRTLEELAEGPGTLGPEDGAGEGAGEAAGPRYPWDGSDRDYLYEELLGELGLSQSARGRQAWQWDQQCLRRGAKPLLLLLTRPEACWPTRRPGVWHPAGEQPGADGGEAADGDEAAPGAVPAWLRTVPRNSRSG